MTIEEMCEWLLEQTDGQKPAWDVAAKLRQLDAQVAAAEELANAVLECDDTGTGDYLEQLAHTYFEVGKGE